MNSWKFEFVVSEGDESLTAHQMNRGLPYHRESPIAVGSSVDTRRYTPR